MKKVAVVLSGCGFKDGAEITESVSALIALSQLETQYQCFAPNLDFEATNHLDGGAQGVRNCLQEAARISRGEIQDLLTLQSGDFDAILFPGGFGAALHLCDWAHKGSECSVHQEVQRVITSFFEEGKPIGVICIAPVLAAKILGHRGVNLTIGNDEETAKEITKTGAKHIECPVDDYVTDRECKVVSTPAYMLNAEPAQVFKGISGLVRELVEMA